MSTISHNAKAERRARQRALINRTREALAISATEREVLGNLARLVYACAGFIGCAGLAVVVFYAVFG
jgi:hypothetical protein